MRSLGNRLSHPSRKGARMTTKMPHCWCVHPYHITSPDHGFKPLGHRSLSLSQTKWQTLSHQELKHDIHGALLRNLQKKTGLSRQPSENIHTSWPNESKDHRSTSKKKVFYPAPREGVNCSRTVGRDFSGSICHDLCFLKNATLLI